MPNPTITYKNPDGTDSTIEVGIAREGYARATSQPHPARIVASITGAPVAVNDDNGIRGTFGIGISDWGRNRGETAIGGLAAIRWYYRTKRGGYSRQAHNYPKDRWIDTKEAAGPILKAIANLILEDDALLTRLERTYRAEILKDAKHDERRALDDLARARERVKLSKEQLLQWPKPFGGDDV